MTWSWVFVAAFMAVSSAVQAGDIRVLDGDTLQIGSVRYRLHGIDAPELHQVCGDWACGLAAKSRLEALTAGLDVTCEDRDRDRYGRIVAVCYALGADLNRQMVREGLAWAYRRYSWDYAADEEEARGLSRGVWQVHSEPPWLYRDKLRAR